MNSTTNTTELRALTLQMLKLAHRQACTEGTDCCMVCGRHQRDDLASTDCICEQPSVIFRRAEAT